MTVLSIAFSYAPVGPNAVGGAEQILTALDEALVANGHHSVVLAADGSEAAGRLYAFPRRQPELDEDARRRYREQRQRTLDQALASERVDLVHMHGLDFFEYALPENMPVLVTLHLPIAWYPPEIWERTRDRFHFHCVSASQRRSCPVELGAVEVIENGVALPPVHLKRARQNYALVMGRICPEKNAHAALESGDLANMPVRIAGRIFPYKDHERYVHEMLSPLLEERESAPRHEFLGPLAWEERFNTLAEAKCLLHPTLAEETSSLVAMEAMAAGTPVIAYPSGALPEIVEDGVTGFLVNDVEQMAAAIKRVDAIDPDVCRETAGRRFSRQRMVGEIFELYEKLIRQSKRAPARA